MTIKPKVSANDANIAAMFKRIGVFEEENKTLREAIESLTEARRLDYDHVCDQARTISAMETAHAAAIDKLEKELKSCQSTRDYHSTQLKTATDELAQLHALLDALPGALPRESPNPDNKYSDTKHSAMTRLASWLALR